jgi:hypothetical protein
MVIRWSTAPWGIPIASDMSANVICHPIELSPNALRRRSESVITKATDKEEKRRTTAKVAFIM